MKIYHFKKVTSTNDVAKKIVLLRNLQSKFLIFQEKCPAFFHEMKGEKNFAVVADEQTKGKGRMNRGWLSPFGGLYFSIATKKNPMLPLIAGVTVAVSLKNFGLFPVLKWPNDVMVGDKKISGILIECLDDFAVVGVGVNINKTPLETATSINDETGKNVSRDAVLNSILKNFEKFSKKNVLDEYKKLCSTIGRRVKIKATNKVIDGKAVDVDEHGRLVLESGEKIVSGDVIHLM
ncbi:MAG: biotin--[acetyl-CoA-carboxylase] ligase [Thermoplasmatales archaeon]|nr:biotin--[acetyl-CoA-carboxylase] ligase [Thermoplasmatales archaeon]